MSKSDSKTPMRYHRARSEAKTPLGTMNLLVSGLSNVQISGSPTKKRSAAKPTTGPADITNPFLAPPSQPRASTRPISPIKRAFSQSTSSLVVTAELQRQAGGGVIRKGGIESRMDVVSLDLVPQKKSEIKRSRSQPGIRDRETLGDRFITTRERDPETDVVATLEQIHLDHKSASPGHTARLIEATGVPLNRRVLGYHEPPPVTSNNPALAQQRECLKLLNPRPASLSSSSGAYTNKSRKISTQPERVLDAPGLVDDFYLNLLSWSCQNAIVVALERVAYVWKADSGTVIPLGEPLEDDYVASVEFSGDGMFVGVGTGSGDVQLWDVERNVKLRTMSGHQSQVAALSWNEHLVSSGCGDGSIWHHDVRVPRHKVMELNGHTGEVCGLKWRSDGEMLASGGNDNVVNIWDGRCGDSGEGFRGTAKWTKRNHTAAVKALAWSPWQPNLLASGGGTNDATINVWNSTTGARLHTQITSSQITSIHWAPHKRELVTTHGFPTNSVMLHAYPSMERVAEIRDAHTSRVLFSCVGPAGDVLCTGAGDENLKFWRLWDLTADKIERKKREMEDNRRLNSTSSRVMAIR